MYIEILVADISLLEVVVAIASLLGAVVTGFPLLWGGVAVVQLMRSVVGVDMLI